MSDINVRLSSLDIKVLNKVDSCSDMYNGMLTSTERISMDGVMVTQSFL